MRAHILRSSPLAGIFAALAILFAAGCQGTAPIPPYGELSEQVKSGEAVSVEALRAAFIAQENFPEQINRLVELEEQALAILEDEPLKLGAIGSAILDLFYGSLAGHYAMQRFYEHVGSDNAGALHSTWIERIESATTSGAGSALSPWPVMTRSEAQTHMRMRNLEPVGGLYQTTEDFPFMLLMVGKPEEGALTQTYYNVGPMYEALQRRANAAGSTDEVTPFTLVGLLARESDTAAQAAVGALLAGRQRMEDAIGWLRAASRSGNVLANTLLARIFFDASTEEEDEHGREKLLEETLDNYVHAIALGSTDAMYALAVLYLGEHYGEENIDAGLPLLQRAADQGHTPAMVYLGHLHAEGDLLEASSERAAAEYIRAASLGDRRGTTAYARLLIAEQALAPDERILGWLETLADGDDSEAMLLLANLHARGVAAAADSNRAVRWFKRAVRVDPADANIVNEVAWTLTVSDIDSLRRERYAQRIMERVMSADEQARTRPEYLDTWAATYAAAGNFERAIELQQQAIARALEQQREGVVDILQVHLAKFQAGEVIIEAAP